MLLSSRMPSSKSEIQALVSKARAYSIPKDPKDQERLISECVRDLKVLHHQALGDLPRRTTFTVRLQVLSSQRPVLVGQALHLAHAQATVIKWLMQGSVRPLLLRQTSRFCRMESKVGLEKGGFYLEVVEEAQAVLYNWKEGSSPVGMLSALLPMRVSGLWRRLSLAAERQAASETLIKAGIKALHESGDDVYGAF